MAIYSRIAGTGSYLPEKVLTNADLEKMVDTSDEWIVSRSGIRERHIAEPEQTTSDLAYEASLKALEAAGMTADVEPRPDERRFSGGCGGKQHKHDDMH